jgi:hypothetical protein
VHLAARRPRCRQPRRLLELQRAHRRTPHSNSTMAATV